MSRSEPPCDTCDRETCWCAKAGLLEDEERMTDQEFEWRIVNDEGFVVFCNDEKDARSMVAQPLYVAHRVQRRPVVPHPPWEDVD